MHKTGSTTIQQYLFANSPGQTAVYAQLGDANHSARIYNLFSAKALTYHLNKSRGWGPHEIARCNHETRQMLLANIAASGQADFIISGEDISVLEEGELRSMKAFLEPHFASIVIAGYVRAPHSFMNSDFQQRVKGTLARLSPAQHYPHYRRRFEKFDNVFGRENVLLWNFDPKSFPRGCVVTDFGGKVGIAVDPEKVARVNESLSRDALALLFAHRKFGRGFGTGPGILRENKLLISALSEIDGPKARLSPALVDPVIRSNRKDVAWMENRLGTSFSEDAGPAMDSDITSEEDLLSIRPETLERLKALIRPAGIPPPSGADRAEYAAILVEALRQKIKLEDQATRKLGTPGTVEDPQRKADLGPIELLELVNQARPDLAHAMPAKKAAALIHETLVQLGKHLGDLDQGFVRVSGLGVFKIEQVEREVEGKKATMRVVRFKGRHTAKAVERS
jgi:hypothetical protein